MGIGLTALAIVLLLVTETAAQGQGLGSGLGQVNPFTPQFTPDPTTGQPVPTQPFTTQPNHLNNPFPTLPWNQFGVYRIDYGTVVRYLTVPPQPAVITLSVPNGLVPETREETVEIPGYYITETTTGYWYPERWGLQQLTAGVYRWVRVPAEFRRK